MTNNHLSCYGNFGSKGDFEFQKIEPQDSMDKNEIGEMLKVNRLKQNIKPEEMAIRLGCNRTTLVRMENGTSSIARSKISLVAQAYGIEATELAKSLGYSDYVTGESAPFNVDSDSKILATVEDLEFLLGVARVLQTPMNLMTIRDLLKCRQPKSAIAVAAKTP